MIEKIDGSVNRKRKSRNISHKIHARDDFNVDEKYSISFHVPVMFPTAV